MTCLLREATKLLDETGLPYDIEPGKRHHVVRLAGKAIGVLPRGHSYDPGRGWKNFRASVRRRVKEVSNGPA